MLNFLWNPAGSVACMGLLDYRISIAWWTFALAGLSALTIVFLTIGFHVIRAALVNPSENLHSE